MLQKKKIMKIKSQLFLYMLRWQASSPILAAAVFLVPGGTVVKVVAANLIGSLVFFNVDKWIMSRKKHFG